MLTKPLVMFCLPEALLFSDIRLPREGIIAKSRGGVEAGNIHRFVSSFKSTSYMYFVVFILY
jgi:hypothetical protein